MKINLTTLGCPKNLVDSEFLFGGLKGENVQFVENPAEAETIILNTCGFIQGAKEESIDAILAAVALKKQGKCKRVFVTGCLSQRYPEALHKEIPEVDGFYGNRDISRIVRELTEKLDLKREILGERLLTTPKHFAYLKISEGCENPCTFCSIPGIRGKFKSRTIESLVAEAEMLADKGVQELILIAQDTTIYGVDIYGEKRLVPLLDKLSSIKRIKWIRLLYTYPAHFSDELIELIVDRRDIINYVDMPVQHVSNRLLKNMARKVTRTDIESIISKLRKGNPDIALRSTFIVGFPGETEDDHNELIDFMEEVHFERLGLFAYSREEDTPSYNFPDQIPEHIIQERLAELNDIQTEISNRFNESLLDKTLTVLIDEFDQETGAFVGRASYDCPEIDNSVIIKTAGLTPGDFIETNIIDCNEYNLFAKT